MDKTRDKLLQPEHHDLPQGMAPAQRHPLPTMRRRLPGRTLDLERPGRCEQRPGSPRPACQRIAEDVPAGTISLRGAFVKAHADELSGLIRNTEERKRANIRSSA